MANPNLTDMTEEDAADLQFPKGMSFFRGNKRERKKNETYLFLTYNQMMMFVIVFSIKIYV